MQMDTSVEEKSLLERLRCEGYFYLVFSCMLFVSVLSMGRMVFTCMLIVSLLSMGGSGSE